MSKNSFDALYGSLGTVIRQIRLLRGLSQKELSKLSGVTQGFISYVEKGTKKPTLEILEQIANGLGVPSYLLLYKAKSQVKRDSLCNHPEYSEFFSVLYDNFDMATNLYLAMTDGKSEGSKSVNKSETHTNRMDEIRQELMGLQNEVRAINEDIKNSLVGENEELLMLS